MRKVSGESALWWATLLLVFVSCGTSLAETGEKAAHSPQVIGGAVVARTEDNAQASGSVVGIMYRVSASPQLTVFCSGVLISPIHVLTAAHCFDEATAANTAVYFPFAANGASRVIDVAEVTKHPDYDPMLPTNVLVPKPPEDLAILQLKQVHPSTYTPAAVASAIAATDEGIILPKQLLLAGFGVTEGRDLRDGGVLRAAMLNLDSQDEPRQTIGTQGGTVGSPAGGCAGDSGAPLFSPGGVVLGILSTGGEIEGRCIGTNSFSDLRYSNEWITDVVSAVNQAGVFEAVGVAQSALSNGQILIDASKVELAVLEGRGGLPLSFEIEQMSPLLLSKGDPQCRLEADIVFEASSARGAALLKSKWRSPRFRFGGGSGGVSLVIPMPAQGKGFRSASLSMICAEKSVALVPSVITAP